MNEEIKKRSRLSGKGKRQRQTWGFSKKPATNQVRLTDYVAIVTGPQFKLSLYKKRPEVTLYLRFELPPFLEQSAQSFPHLRVNKLLLTFTFQ